MSWKRDRIEELGKLEKLLWNVSSLNNGNHFIEHVGEAVKIAKELRDSDISKPRESFLTFLIKQANSEATQ